MVWLKSPGEVRAKFELAVIVPLQFREIPYALIAIALLPAAELRLLIGTLDTDGAAHVPSPLQYVDDDAPLPLFRFATGIFGRNDESIVPPPPV